MTNHNMTNQSTLSSKLSAAFTVLTLSAMITPAAFAGEAYVTNTHRNTWGYSETDLNIKQDSFSRGSREYAAVADKIYIDGKINVEQFDDFDRTDFRSTVEKDPSTPSYQETSFAPFGKNVVFDKFTVHTASSVDVGGERFGSDTFVDGFIFSHEEFDETSHTTAAGVR